MASSLTTTPEYPKMLQHMTTIIHFCENGPLDENGRRMRIVNWISTFVQGINATVAEYRSCIRVIRNFEASPMTTAPSATPHIMYPWEATKAVIQLVNDVPVERRVTEAVVSFFKILLIRFKPTTDELARLEMEIFRALHGSSKSENYKDDIARILRQDRIFKGRLLYGKWRKSLELRRLDFPDLDHIISNSVPAL
ncbi:uncharacterized protein LOC110861148 [Folsomia candida]|uniref:uncharacterized protein LOC110861148 n=1 Tax=Folsomia candida TaxID=158441 RepID=UPI0016053D07|nr:uncharacterized protein LOC110861148 [Folsomia candida]